MMTRITVYVPVSRRGKNDAHYYLCDYFACGPWNYPSNNTVVATVAQDPQSRTTSAADQHPPRP